MKWYPGLLKSNSKGDGLLSSSLGNFEISCKLSLRLLFMMFGIVMMLKSQKTLINNDANFAKIVTGLKRSLT